jgi:hypothetical protein
VSRPVPAAIGDGFRAVRRNWGLVLLLLAVNAGLAALLAVPLAGRLEAELRHRDAAAGMMYGFDYTWWSEWSERQSGWTRSFGPELFGSGFAYRNLDLLLRGYLPGRLYRAGAPRESAGGGDEPLDVDPVILGLGLLYMLVQTFLAGGVLGVLRSPQGGWTVRGLLHGSGFYFGRMVRVAALALVAAYVLFRINAPLARWADRQALEAVSESTALAWSLGRHAVLLLALLVLHMVSSYAKVIVVLEERSSALLAFVSSAAFCLRHPLRTWGQYLAIGAAGVTVLVGWNVVDGLWETTGYKTQLATLLLLELLVAARIGLRLALLGGQVALFRRTVAVP